MHHHIIRFYFRYSSPPTRDLHSFPTRRSSDLGAEYTRSLDAVWNRLSVSGNYNRVSRREQVVERGLRRLGWHVDAMPRNVRGCEQGVICGRCGFGCPLGAKQSTLVTWLVDAQAAGARILAETRADRVGTENGVATGVDAKTAG